MGDKSAIQWTDATWNPVTGCTKVSPGCKHCYAEKVAERMRRLGQPNYRNGFELTLQPHMLSVPLKWQRPRRIFVNSMSDLFHGNVPAEYIAAVFGVMAAAPQHTFQVLTKRAERMPKWLEWAARNDFEAIRDAGDDLAGRMQWCHSGQDEWVFPLPNVWLGVSIERDDYVHRIEALQACPAAVRFLSLEPLLGPMPELDLYGIHWVIIGGESGPGARPLELDWVRDIREQCRRAGVACFVKQLGRVWAREHLADPKGGDMSRWPEDLRVREMPAGAL